MVGHENFFEGSLSPTNGARLAPPRPDYRWRHIAQKAIAPEPPSFPEAESPFEPPPETFPPPAPEFSELPHRPEAAPSPPEEPPHIRLLKIAQMYGEEWRPAKIATSESKAYAVLLPRDSKLSVEQAIKRRQAIMILMDENGRLEVRDLRAISPHKKLSWWKRIFRWR